MSRQDQEATVMASEDRWWRFLSDEVVVFVVVVIVEIEKWLVE